MNYKDSNLTKLQSLLDELQSNTFQQQIDEARELYENDILVQEDSNEPEFYEFILDGNVEKSESIPQRESIYLDKNDKRELSKPDLNSVNSSPFLAQHASFFKDMVDYKDKTASKCRFCGYQAYWPTYTNMDAKQLNYYFYWRSEARKGNFIRSDSGYILLLAYEILSGIGWEKPQEGYELLNKLWQAYYIDIQHINPYFFNWTFDFAVYYNLKYKPFTQADIYQKYDHKIENYILNESLKSGGLLKIPMPVIKAISNYNITESKIYTTKNRETVDEALPRAVSLVDAYLKKNTGQGILKTYRPKNKQQINFSLYVSALAPDANRQCYLSQYNYFQNESLRDFITQIVRETENALRTALDCRGQLKKITLPKEIKDLIKAFIRREYGPKEELLIEPEPKREQNSPVSLSRDSKLDRELIALLREESDEVRDALEVSSEANPVLGETTKKPDFIPTEPKQAHIQLYFNVENLPEELKEFLESLTEQELKTVRAILLRQTDTLQKIADEALSLPELIFDAINNKAMESLDDIIIDVSQGSPEILDEYQEDLKENLI